MVVSELQYPSKKVREELQDISTVMSPLALREAAAENVTPLPLFNSSSILD